MRVTDPLSLGDELEAALDVVVAEARRYLGELGDHPVLAPGAEAEVERWSERLPEEGDGAVAALTELTRRTRAAATRSSGPRFFHFVMGGGTPAALGADWLTSAIDQIAFAWASSPLAARLEAIAVDWLRDLFELPDDFQGALVTGATMANLTGLTAARGWWAERHGFDVDEQGLARLPEPALLAGGHIHPSALQAVGMLGLGRANVRRLAADETGRLDLPALERELEKLNGAPAIIVATAGEVNAGDFDPIEALAELSERHDAWLHVDGAFGIFARLSPRTRHLVAGLERAHSVAGDGHKWLNVPYDCGFAFVREPERLARAFSVGAPYLPSREDPHPNPSFVTPENSRRARALTVWATLRAYGRDGYRAMVERHLDLAGHLAALVDAAPDFERLAEVPLNVVCFRARPPGVPDEELDRVNRELGEELLRDGRVFAGTTRYAGKVAFRPAIVNWQTTERDVELLLEVLRELRRQEIGR